MQDHKFLICFVSTSGVAKENLESGKILLKEICENLNSLNEEAWPKLSD